MKKRLTSRYYLPGAASAALAVAMVGCASKSSEPMTYQETRPVVAAPTVTATPTVTAESTPVAAAPAPAPASAPMVSTASRSSRRASVPAGMSSAVISFPTGQESSSVLLVENMGPVEVQAGVPFDYTIRATNLTSEYELRNLVVTQEVPGTYNIRTNDPNIRAAGRTENGLELIDFNVGELGPGETRTITVNALSNEEGILEICTTAEYDMYVCWQTRVVRPNVTVTKKGPAEVLICDPINYEIVVTNEGTGAAKGLVLTDTLPAGLTSGGQQVVRREIGELGPGQSQSFTITADASATGSYSNVAEITGNNITVVSSPVTTRVVKPVLTIDKTAPEVDYVGSRLDYAITVTNAGDAPATQARLVDTLPAGVTFESATDGGVLQGSNVVWELGTLAVGESRSFRVTVRGAEKGVQRNTAVATATCAEQVEDSVLTEIVGIPAVLLEVIDIVDPVKVGEQTTDRKSVV